MRVQRIHTDNGSHIEPPLNDEWSSLDRLRWCAAVEAMDAGLNDDAITVDLGDYRVDGRPVESFDVRYPGGVTGPGSYRATWDLITGIGIGLRMATR